MNNQLDLSTLIGSAENEHLEYKAVLPPARTIAQLIGAFANTNGGGVIILGVAENNGKIEVNGLSEDFRANAIIHTALDLLSPKPAVSYGYQTYLGKRLFVIQIEKSLVNISIEGKIYIRQQNKNLLTNPPATVYNPTTYAPITTLADKLQSKSGSSDSMGKFLDHYKRVLNIIADLKHLLFPNLPSSPTTNNEGKILIRILFSSCADNLETYLSDLLYEIYLAKPSTLKASGQQVTVKEVLDCADMQEFITYIAKKKLSKLQRGSVKGFIADNEQIANLNAISASEQTQIESILQIRHLYAHKNGIVDEKFLQFFPGQYTINDTYELSIDDFLTYMEFLAEMVSRIDEAAVIKYSLATV